MSKWRNAKLGTCLTLRNERNDDRQIGLVLTVSNTRGVIPQSENFNRGRTLASENTAAYRVVRKGDFAYNPARVNVGSIARLSDYDAGIISPMYICFATSPELSGNYLEHFLQTRYFADAVKCRLSGSVRECLNFAGLSDIDFVYPADIAEQQRIADVLTAADDAIAASRILIDKYEDIKEGLMQDLLSGAVRINEYSGKRISLVIGALLELKNGLNKGKQFFGQGVPIVHYMDVYSKRSIQVSDLAGRVSLTKSELDRFRIRKGDVFFTRTSETTEEIGVASVLLDDVEEGAYSGFVFRGRPKGNKLDVLYCQFCFSTPDVRRKIIELATHTTRAGIAGTALAKVPVSIVVDTDEQRAIAERIMSADERLAAERIRLTKLENIKRGLMDDLLTNKVSIDVSEGGRKNA